MAVEKRDILFSIKRGFWQKPETISRTGYKPPQVVPGVLIKAENRSLENLRWLNADLMHWVDETTTSREFSERRFQEDESRKYIATRKRTGWLKATVKFDTIAKGQIVERLLEAPGVWTILNFYGQDESGNSFNHQLRPDVVVGLTETVKVTSDCFVATAAYQDTNHPIVQQLRFVRDEILVRSRLGRGFIISYYRHGPKLANVVRPRASLRFASRCVLTPIGNTVRAGRYVYSKFWQHLLPK